jgi:hypothetical protein
MIILVLLQTMIVIRIYVYNFMPIAAHGGNEEEVDERGST